jgi:hypothetical protein
MAPDADAADAGGVRGVDVVRRVDEDAKPVVRQELLLTIAPAPEGVLGHARNRPHNPGATALDATATMEAVVPEPRFAGLAPSRPAA